VLKITWSLLTYGDPTSSLVATWMFAVQHLFYMYMYLPCSENVAVCQQLQVTIKLHGTTNVEHYHDTYRLGVFLR